MEINNNNADMEDIPFIHQIYYRIATIIHDNIGNRKLVMWTKNNLLETYISKYYGINVAFYVTIDKNKVNNKIHFFDELENKQLEYYLSGVPQDYDSNLEHKLSLFGYVPVKDYVMRGIKPIILTNFELNGKYQDIYGNTITGKGVIKKIVFRGYNNQITIGNNISGLQNVIFDLLHNSQIVLDDNIKFYNTNIRIETKGPYTGISKIHIKSNCILKNSLFRVFAYDPPSSIEIGANCTFEDDLKIHANTGKQIIIGNDCMFSYQVVVLSGDGHSIIDLDTGKTINKYGNDKDKIILGDHIWVGLRSTILTGSIIGEGSIIGTGSLVKGQYPNNCTIAGNPCKLIRKNIAWDRDPFIEDLWENNRYCMKSLPNPPLSCKNILLFCGFEEIDTALIIKLLQYGNNVTIANYNINTEIVTKNIFVDVSNKNEMKKIFQGHKYDIIINNNEYESKSIKNILDNISCAKYIQLMCIGPEELSPANIIKSNKCQIQKECFETTNISDIHDNDTSDTLINDNITISKLLIKIPQLRPPSITHELSKPIPDNKLVTNDRTNTFSSSINYDKLITSLLHLIADDTIDGVFDYSPFSNNTLYQMIKK